MKKILAIVPAYNESGSIRNVIENIKKQNDNIDILVINDCSEDNTSELAQQAGAVVIDLVNNLGIGGAVQTGFIYAYKHNYDVAFQIDGDGQHPAEYIKNLIDPVLNEECDICCGSRFIGEGLNGFQSSFFRRLGINILCYAIAKTTGFSISDPTSGFRAYNRKTIIFLKSNYPDDYPEPESAAELILNNFKYREIPVIMKERKSGVSSIDFVDSIYYMIKVSASIILKKIKYKFFR
jgi:glycosyltransferase involved in cell wall biosynthesis